MTADTISPALHPLSQFEYCPRCGTKGFGVINAKAKQCAACGFVYYYNPSAAAVGVIVDNERRLLVSRRAKEPAKGTLDLPGGFVDPQESTEEALRRELFEETGLKVGEMKFLFSLPNIYPYSGFDVHTVDHFFYWNAGGCTEVEAADDVSELLWIPFNEVDPDMFGLTSIKRGLKRMMEDGVIMAFPTHHI